MLKELHERNQQIAKLKTPASSSKAPAAQEAFVFKPDSSCSACNSLRVVKILHPAVEEHEKLNKLENKRLYGKVDYEESKDSVDDCEGTDEKCTE